LTKYTFEKHDKGSDKIERISIFRNTIENYLPLHVTNIKHPV
jgi:hypothetical protein